MILQVFRDSLSPGKDAFVYGQRSHGTVLCPLDLIFMRSTGKPHATNPQQFSNGTTNVSTSDGATLGTIQSYAFPVSGAVVPLVEVATAETNFLQIGQPTLGLAAGTSVFVQLDGRQVNGVIRSFNGTTVPYVKAANSVSAYHVEFDNSLTKDEHGAPVFTTGDARLVGMLIVANPVTVTGFALVCPC